MLYLIKISFSLTVDKKEHENRGIVWEDWGLEKNDQLGAYVDKEERR